MLIELTVLKSQALKVFAFKEKHLNVRYSKKLFTTFVLSVLCIGVLAPFAFIEAAPLLQRSSQENTQNNTNQNSESSTQGNVIETESALLTYELFKQIETMQTQIQHLRGLLEEQNYEIERLKKAERERYADLDRRMTELRNPKNNISNADLAVAGQGSILAIDEDEKTYLSAKAKVDSKEYNAAIAEFTLYLEFFPDGKYVAQAHYWMGELYMALEFPEYENALSHFEIVVNDFPTHSKMPGSLYKIGLIHLEKTENAKAKLTFQKLVKDFPSSATTSLAKKQLENL
jgi:tol-pal system protein YbgF